MIGTIRSYRQLQVWQRAMDLVTECYRISSKFPRDELYGLISQMRRSAVSVPANIAEGQGRRHTREFVNHLSIALGSLMELETHIQIAVRLEYVDAEAADRFLEESGAIGRMLNGLTRSLLTSARNSRRTAGSRPPVRATNTTDNIPRTSSTNH